MGIRAEKENKAGKGDRERWLRKASLRSCCWAKIGVEGVDNVDNWEDGTAGAKVLGQEVFSGFEEKGG